MQTHLELFMRRNAFAFIIALALAPALSQAQTVAPRTAVGSVGKAIADTYFDASRGAEIAADLETAAARGEFDALTDARDLAEELTRRLTPLDRHFRVNWTAPAPLTHPTSSDASPQVERLPFREIARKANYGFSQVQVLPGNVGLITLDRFFPIDFADPRTPARLTADAALRMVGDADAVIIDLRDNGGGDPTMVGYLASAFLPAGLDAYNVFRSRDGVEREAPLQTYPEPRPQTPVFILVSGRTGSAAEGLSYTLQAAGRAVIVGEPTRGAANPGGPVDASDGLSVFVPTGSPRNPITGGNGKVQASGPTSRSRPLKPWMLPGAARWKPPWRPSVRARPARRPDGRWKASPSSRQPCRSPTIRATTAERSSRPPTPP